MVKPRLLLPFVIIGALMVIWGLAVQAPASAAPLSVDRVFKPPAQQTEQYCLSCHSNPDLKMTLPSGEELSLYISPEHLKSSVHSPAGIECEACHTEIKTYPHPAINFQTRRELSRSYYQACQKCHPANYEKAQDSMHAKAAAEGNLKAAICTDCHGAHSVSQARADKLKSSKRCGRCHQEIFKTYTESVHGTALVQEHNTDVPICADCHTAHSIQGAHTQDYRDKVPEICGQCHGNATLMKKYGLSPGVVNSYLQDFHGVTLKLYRGQRNDDETTASRKAIATCVDCHGIHDITKTTGPTTNLVKSRLMKRCQKCHPGATDDFPDAWLSHYEPSLRNAPLVYLINLTYKVFIPFMLIGLILQILLHVWRYAVNR